MQSTTFISCDRFSQSEFADWVEDLSATDIDHYELLDGHIVREPPAGWPHGEIGSGLLARLVTFVQEHDLGRVFDSSQGFELPSGDTVEPDISFVSNDNWKPPSRPHKFLELVPDFIVEILSPSTKGHDRTQKKRIYERNGVREYWLVDPLELRVTRFARIAGRFDDGTEFRGDDEARSVLLPGLSIPLADLFPRP